MREEKPADANREISFWKEKAIEDRKQALIGRSCCASAPRRSKPLMDQLAKLGHKFAAGKPKKSHHKAPTPTRPAPAKGKAKD